LSIIPKNLPMEIYGTEVIPLQGLSSCSVDAVFQELDGYSTYIFKQPDIVWCPYRQIIMPYRTLKLVMQMPEPIVRKHVLYNPRYIRCIYAHAPLIKDTECEEEAYEKQLQMQLMKESNLPMIDEFGMYVYMRLEISEEPFDLDLRITEHTEREKFYNYDSCYSKPSLTGDRVSEDNLRPSLVHTV